MSLASGQSLHAASRVMGVSSSVIPRAPAWQFRVERVLGVVPERRLEPNRSRVAVDYHQMLRRKYDCMACDLALEIRKRSIINILSTRCVVGLVSKNFRPLRGLVGGFHRPLGLKQSREALSVGLRAQVALIKQRDPGAGLNEARRTVEHHFQRRSAAYRCRCGFVF